jgi:circadian clock protein KaiB
MTAKKARVPARTSLAKARPSRAVVRTKRPHTYVLRLYVAGVDRKSTDAIKAVTRFCDERLKGRYELEIVDIYQQPALARREQIIAAPTLVRKLPLPPRRLVGNMTDLDTVLVGRGLRPTP